MAKGIDKGAERVIAKDGPGRVLHDRGTSDRPSKYEGIGNEKREDIRGVQEGGSRAEAEGMHVGKTHLGHAVEELHKQHPHHHSEGGIHHTRDHIRHEPHHMGPGAARR